MAYIKGWQFKNIAASTGGFDLVEGQYAVQAVATWGGGSVTLQRLSSDGSTYVTCLTAMTANSYATVNLPAGTYKFTIATATAVYVDIMPILTVDR